MCPQSPSIHLLPPPGPSVLLLSRDDASPSSVQGQGTSTSTVAHQLFLAAHKVRFEVFVKEQHCSAANEIDTDDAISWHWIIYAPPSPPPKGDYLQVWPEPVPVVIGKAPPVEGGPEVEGGGWHHHHHHLPNNNINNNNKNDNTDINNSNSKKSNYEESGSVIPVATTRLVPFPPSPSPSPPTAAASPQSGGEEGGAGTAAEQQQQPPTHTHTATKMWNGKEPYIQLGRLATLPSHRGLGFGRVLIDSALKWAVYEKASILQQRPHIVTKQGTQGKQEKKEKNKEQEKAEKEEEEEGNNNNRWNGLVLVHAQRDVEAWYRSLHGFVTDEDMGVWIEEGIEHVGMWRRLDLSGEKQEQEQEAGGREGGKGG